MVFEIRLFLSHNNSIQGGRKLTPFISRRRSVCESTARSFSENASVSCVYLVFYCLSSSNYRSGKSRILSGYAKISPAGTSRYAHISLFPSLDRQVSDYVLFCNLTYPYRFVVPGILALGGAMKKLKRYLTLEVEQRLRDMQEAKKDIPVGHIRKQKKFPSTC